MFELDDDGYPTEETLDYIAKWQVKYTDDSTDNEIRQQYFDLFEGIKSIWWYASWGWTEMIEPSLYRENEKSRQYHISTGGWSGNESIIRAMESNSWIHCTWVQSRRGGHYIYELELIDVNSSS